MTTAVAAEMKALNATIKSAAVNDLQSALNQLEAVKKRTRLVVEACFPIGTVIGVKLGNARITGEVEGYGFWWSEPRELRIRNVRTGKKRTVTLGYNWPQVLSYPERNP